MLASLNSGKLRLVGVLVVVTSMLVWALGLGLSYSATGAQGASPAQASLSAAQPDAPHAPEASLTIVISQVYGGAGCGTA
ncbi:MAG TPA: hypothetical protein VGE04_17315, partial [Chloroflexia bacterium]